jgi:hypothetical protein
VWARAVALASGSALAFALALSPACVEKRTSAVGAPAPTGSEAGTARRDSGEAGGASSRIPSRDAIPEPAGMTVLREDVASPDGRHEVTVGPFARDTCLRVGIDTSAGIALEIAEAGGPFARAAGKVDAPTLFPAEGPICFLRGRTARVTIDGHARVILVVWAS